MTEVAFPFRQADRQMDDDALTDEIARLEGEIEDLGLEFLDAAGMRLYSVYGAISELVYGLEVPGKHVRVLVIFGGDVALDGVGHGDIV